MLKKFFPKTKNDRSFTLTETIIMISIILILTGIIVVSTEASRALARDKKRIAHFAAYKVALQRYYSNHKYYPYPGSSTDCTNAGCSYDNEKKICTCPAHTYLIMLKNEGYLDEMMQDPKNISPYIYSYNVDDNGKNFKLVVPLEKDKTAMENDGGSDPNFYEVYSTLGAHLAFNYWGRGGVSNLVCMVRSDSCLSGEVLVLRLSGTNNAHAELYNQNNYRYLLCCSAPGLGVSTTSSTISTLLLRLSSQTNAHVERNDQPKYSNTVYLTKSGGSISCSGPKSSCVSGEVCVVSISGNTNAHIGNCDAYPNKICCKAPSF